MKSDLNNVNIAKLQDMLDKTDWAVSSDTCKLDELTEVVGGYDNFFAEACIPKHSRPFVESMKRLPADTKIKQLEREKKLAFDSEDTAKRNKVQRDFNRYVQMIRKRSF